MVQGIATTRARLSRAAVLRDNAGSTSREQRRSSAGPRAPPAGMAELVDALDSKSSSGNRVRVRFPLPAPEGPSETNSSTLSEPFYRGRFTHATPKVVQYPSLPLTSAGGIDTPDFWAIWGYRGNRESNRN